METTLLTMINVETSANSAEDRVETTMELVTLDDAMLRHVGGGSPIVMQY